MIQIKKDQEINIPFASWYGDYELTLPFPDNWNVYVAEPADAPELSELQIKEALSHPYGTERLSILAQGKKSAAIAVEDITRPLQVYRFLPEIIKELNNGGIPSENITVIIGGASHRPMNDTEMRKKLGEEVVDQFKPIMHDFMGPDLAYLGWIKGGPVYINKYFIQAQLKICVGSVLPHVEVGFSGGAKLVVPGLAGRLTITHLHGALKGRASGNTEAENGLMAKRAWAEEVAKFIHVDAVVCGVINSNKRIAGLFIGDIIQPQRKAAKMASEIGKTIVNKKIASEADIVIANAYPLDTDPVQMGKALAVAKRINHELTIAINAASDGIFYHGMGMGTGFDLMRLIRNVPGFLFNPVNSKSFIKSMATGIKSPITTLRLGYFSLNHHSYETFNSENKSNRREKKMDDSGLSLLVYSKKFPFHGFKRKYPKGKIFNDWSEIVQQVNKRYQKPNVIVLPCAPIQILRIES